MSPISRLQFLRELSEKRDPLFCRTTIPLPARPPRRAGAVTVCSGDGDETGLAARRGGEDNCEHSRRRPSGK